VLSAPITPVRGRCCGQAKMPGVAELQPSDLLAHGLPGGPSAAASWVARLRALHANADSLAHPAARGQRQQQATLTVWRAISKDLLRPPPEHPFELHQLLYDAVYHAWDVAVLGPRPVWIPTAEVRRARPSASVQTSCGGLGLRSLHGEIASPRARSFRLHPGFHPLQLEDVDALRRVF
jgi:hypothetical protein